MLKVVDVVRRHAPAYLEKYGSRMPAEHKKVLDAMLRCRTEAAGVAVYGCGDCPERRLVPLACGNRHCPNCQYDKTRKWVQKAVDQLLPGPHFMVTFTVPEELRRFFRDNPKIALNALFAASSGALKGALANEKHCGCDRPGFFGVLHTWGRQLQYHPHIHYVVPGGGLDRKSGLWKPTRDDFLVPARTLSKLTREKFKTALRAVGTLHKIPSRAWRRDWVVDVQAVGNNAEGVVKYLAPYVFRVAVSDSRMVEDKNGLITFRYTPSGTKETRLLTVTADEFIRRFLQHVLPTGLVKIRHYGFAAAACRTSRTELAALIALADSESPILTPVLPQSAPEPEPEPGHCPCCGKPQRLLGLWKANRYLPVTTTSADTG